MTCPGNGIYVLQGEMATLLTAMRRGARWSSHSHQDEEQDILIRSFTDLKDILNQIGDLRELDSSHFLGPFLEVIRSEETTGPVTSLALAAINKFLSYGLVDPTSKSVATTVDNIADAVTHARFVGTDQASDGVVLLKILQVLRTLILSPEGSMLTNESVCEIMLSCFRICFETRLSELLRRAAEHYLKDMVQLLFSRLPQFQEDLRAPSNIKKLKMRAGGLDSSRGKRKLRSSMRKLSKPSLKAEEGVVLDTKEKELATGGEVKFQTQDRDGLRVSSTVDVFEREWMNWEKNHQVEVLHLPSLKVLDELVELTLFLEMMSCYLPTHLALAGPEDHISLRGWRDFRFLLNVPSEDPTSPALEVSLSSHLRATHLATTPVTPAGNIVDMQGAIHQGTPLSGDEQGSPKSGDDPETLNLCESLQEGGEDAGTTHPSPTNVGKELVSAQESSVTDIKRCPTVSDDNPQALTEPQPVVEQECNVMELSQPKPSLVVTVEEEQSSVSSSRVGSVEDVSVATTEESKVVDTLEGHEYINPQGVRFSRDVGQDVFQPLVPYGVVCIRELLRFLISLCNPLDKQNTETMVHMGLTLLTVALEVGADSIGQYGSLLVLVRDEMCRNLFSLLNTERLSIFAADLQVSFLLFESLRTHLKFQLELYLTRLIDIVVSDSPKVGYELREIALESVVQLWRIPGLVTELYLNYDCDLYCPNLFEDLTKLLSKNAFPVSGLYNTHLLSLDALLTIIDSIESHCHSRILNNQGQDPPCLPCYSSPTLLPPPSCSPMTALPAELLLTEIPLFSPSPVQVFQAPNADLH
uniref:Mon2/Sec7/BIG1-like HUS domain-containing protein n=1 Tax=Timema shepardi TaxID=629360 RepID=A0A7R9FV00_TIMSH|nr:unnamed protein product [Timema shepardi]